MDPEYVYRGGELDVFAGARRWKAYWSAHVAPHLGPDVLEVGAGIGSNTTVLCGAGVRRWVCLEPDAVLAARAREATRHLAERCQVVVGTLAALDPGERFDAILYADVLEHVDDDRAELEGAARHLRAGGRLVVLAPAHQWLFSEFDVAVAHRRRYSRKTLAAAMPPGLVADVLLYLDSIGLLASLANRVMLRSGRPTPGQIRLWDGALVPCSRLLDPLLGHAVGKSILAVSRKPG